MSQDKQHVRVEYRLRPEVDLDQQKRDIGAFIAGIHAHRATSRYTSFQQEFFVTFTKLLRERCVTPPEATQLSVVATTA